MSNNTTAQRIESLLETMAGTNRFDKLVSVRDEAQRLIQAERTKEEEATKKEVERLTAELSSKRGRLSNLGKVARVTERRKRKAVKAPSTVIGAVV